ncbi:YihY/virulence factor BrkB family protein [Candidatus Nitrospira neomarina]|uniref:YihY/virulence factor BrkB family protein n=1 Tax=Candidatus Nitrospira neomarina TaxID=3020899 RepID=A0AA96GLN1_9BACT|nr:YihY/virulence factor BrkB family protein [Candidatus Nitrospira neomarina]WNM62600.1 YihY/virulence factor BrkB family protein [Candidatus Nitrospira neomarina]
MSSNYTTEKKSGPRGRNATQPSQITNAGWWDILLRVKDQISQDNVSIVAAGVAFYAVLALFPALAAIVSLYGLITEVSDVQAQITSLSSFLPQDAQTLIEEQLTTISTSGQSALSLGAIGGLLFAIWSASKGMSAMITSLNIAYNEEEERSFIKVTALAIGLTVGSLVFVILTLFLITLLPAVLGMLGFGQIMQTVLSLSRWPLLAVIVMGGLAILYRYAPCRNYPRWQWVSWGAGIATLMWIIGSSAFAIYANDYSSYNQTYGSLGAAVILLMWFWLTAFIVMVGAEINSEMERQTRVDTTAGEPEPMGQREAYSADTLGKTSSQHASVGK